MGLLRYTVGTIHAEDDFGWTYMQIRDQIDHFAGINKYYKKNQ